MISELGGSTMADVTAVADTVHDSTAYAKRNALEALPAHAQLKYRSYCESKIEVGAQIKHLRERADELQHRRGFHERLNSDERATTVARAQHETINTKLQRAHIRHAGLDAIISQIDRFLMRNPAAYGPALSTRMLSLKSHGCAMIRRFIKRLILVKTRSDA